MKTIKKLFIIFILLLSFFLIACVDDNTQTTNNDNVEKNEKDDISTYTISLDAQGGGGGTTSIMAESGKALPAISIPVKNDYTFGGYYSNAGGSGIAYYSPQGISLKDCDIESDITLYAYWIYNYQIVQINKYNYSQYFDVKKSFEDYRMNGDIYQMITYTISLRRYSYFGPETNVSLIFYEKSSSGSYSYPSVKFDSKSDTIKHVYDIVKLSKNDITALTVHIQLASGVLSIPNNN